MRKMKKVIISVLKDSEGKIKNVVEGYFIITKAGKMWEPFNLVLIHQLIDCRDKGGSVEITFRETKNDI